MGRFDQAVSRGQALDTGLAIRLLPVAALAWRIAKRVPLTFKPLLRLRAEFAFGHLFRAVNLYSRCPSPQRPAMWVRKAAHTTP